MSAGRGYRAIADYALIGNTHSAALVATDGSIDWCCLPHFDSSAVFLRLLDADRGGYFQIRPHGPFQSRREYRGESAILATTFTTASGSVRLVDFMHAQDIAESRQGVDIAHCHRILRLVEGLDGDVAIDVQLRPTFDYARVPAKLVVRPGVVIAYGRGEGLLLEHALAPMRACNDGSVQGRLTIRAGERRWFVVTHLGNGDPASYGSTDPERLLVETQRNWDRWSSQCTYNGPFHPLVRISARVLKLLTFGPSGALVAAPTTSLPEDVGGVRNWDYRFAWLRDSSLILRALIGLGYHVSAMDFFHWLERLWWSDEAELQIMYSVHSGRDLPEHVLDHLDGYRGSRPVRVGNAAAAQVQLDVFGHVLDAAWVCWRDMGPIHDGLWRVLRRFADEAARRWRESDQGIWEVRGPARHFVSSKLMCWVALDRAVRLATAGGGLLADVDRWQRERDAIRAAILDAGFDPSIGAFTQALGEPTLDASVLLVPLVGFLPAQDPRMRSTIYTVADRLTRNGLVYRYLGDDGLPGSEATFALCTFWLVENLALLGEIERACALFEHVASFASDLGFFSEEIGVDGSLVGNYPQGFTHLGLIDAAMRIDDALRAKQIRRVG